MRKLAGFIAAALLVLSVSPASAEHREGHSRPGCHRRNVQACETTTTTTINSTTTTVETIPTGDFRKGDGYVIEVSNSDTGAEWWDAPYIGEGTDSGSPPSRQLPYADNTWWIEGDRCGYRAAYGFLQSDGVIIGRFTFLRLDGAAYAKINDAYMRDADASVVRNYDGSKPGSPNSDCPESADQAYEPFTGPGEQPVVPFRTPAGEPAEIRDYRGVELLSPDTKFRLIDSDGSDGRVGVLFYEHDLPAVVVYYDGLNGGTVEAFLP